MDVPDVYEFLYDEAKAKQNANIQGAIVGPLAGMLGDAAFENDEGRVCGVDEELLINHPYLGYVQNVLELTRAVNMKGSNQAVAVAMGQQAMQAMETAGVAPNLRPPTPSEAGTQTPVALALNGTRALYGDVKGNGSLNKKLFGLSR